MSEETYYVIGQHRSLAHAERHAQRLRREPDVIHVDIVARRNKRGQFSRNGHYFTFRITKRGKKKRVEYTVNVNYKSKRTGHAFSVQFSVIGPDDLSANDVKQAIIDTVENDGEAPEGFDVQVIDWRGKAWGDNSTAWQALQAPITDKLARFTVVGISSRRSQ